MAQIFHKSLFCRLCLFDGLQSQCLDITSIEIYCEMMHDTFDITIEHPSPEANYTICKECIQRLQDAAQFKLQVLQCEEKYEKYYKNEQGCGAGAGLEEIKVETEFLYNDDGYSHGTSEMVTYKQEGVNNENQIANPVKEFKLEDDVTQDTEIFLEESDAKSNGELNEITVKPKKGIRQRQQKKRKKREASLDIKVETVNGGEVYICKVCGEKCNTHKSLKCHTVQKHRYRCHLCNKEYTKRSSYETHMKNKPFACIYCVKKFCSKKLRLVHIKLHKKLLKYICDMCNKELTSRQTLERHIKLHNGTLPKKLCDICGRSFNDKTQLRKHVQTVHEKLRPFSCSDCSKTFSAKKHLKDHIVTHHLRDVHSVNGVQCNVCTKYFKSLVCLRKHAIIHESREFVCKSCNLSYKDKSKYLSHIRTHRINIFICELCGKNFSRKFCLRRHIKMHNSKKKYPCDICGKRYSQTCGVLSHKKRHHDPNIIVEARFKCNLCKRNVVDLDKHMAVHYNRPYGCSLCNKTFTHNRYLTRHIQIAHMGRKPHACSQCEARYTKLCGLRKHMLKIHNMVHKTEEENSLITSENDNKD